MKRANRSATGLVVMVVSALFLNAMSQSLTDKLSEEESFYQNYGKEEYSKLKIEKDVIGLYDMFGEYITDGVFIYDLHNEANVLNSQREGVVDSMESSTSKEFQKEDLFEKFSNLVVTQDAIGGLKTSFVIGDQITTRFSPLTFNKTNFKGIRWDVWSTGLQMSFLLSRTRPGFLSKQDNSGTAEVVYPLSKDVFGSDYYSKNGGAYRGSQDFSHKSPFGDYDWLWSVHAQNTIANKVDVGLTYINHHVSDVKKGEQWIKGNIPEGWMPEEIHFEFSDLTPLNRNDAGVFVDDVQMLVNGQRVEARPEYAGRFRTVFVGSERDSILLPRDLPIARPQSGFSPIVVAFKTEPKYWYFAGSTRSLSTVSQIKNISFQYTVAGNYLVFVSTSKQIPLCILGEEDPQTGEVEWEHWDRGVEDIFIGMYNRPLKIYQSPSEGGNEEQYSTTFFGEYVRKSPKVLTMSEAEFTSACHKDNISSTMRSNPMRGREVYNFYRYRYDYQINISSVTYGADFRGELGGVKFSGEVALNQKESKLPTSDGERTKTNRVVGTLKAERPIGKRLGIDGDVYYISPDWQTNMDNLKTSRYFKETNYKAGGYEDYLAYPKPLGNDWYHVDDNDDNDAFVESDRRHYPSDLNNDQQGNFYSDGTLRWDQGVKPLRLPTDMRMAYDDPDGVIASKDDRNRNGEPDWREDFLLFGSDPPVFELGIDLNNNNVPDYEDDDILPDFGHSVGYFITDNSVKTQGIQGVSLNLHWLLRDDVTMDLGVVGESVLDHDLNGIADHFEGGRDGSVDFFEGKSFVGYHTIQLEVVRRSKGILIELGNELRAIADAIRNDAVLSRGRNDEGRYIVDYSFKIDPLNFRRAVVDNLVGTIVYNNIPNFEYGFRAKLGAQGRMALPDSFNVLYSFEDNVENKTIFSERKIPYDTRVIGDVFLVNRARYTIGFNNEFEDWRRFLNFFNRLEIVPQYKLAYFMSKEIIGPTKNDPRNLREHYRFDTDGDMRIDSLLDDYEAYRDEIDSARYVSRDYRDNNRMELISVPIIRLNYKIAENTQFQFGVQWKRYIDRLTSEKNALNLSILGQIVSKATYKGYNVTFFLGARWRDFDWDVLTPDPVLGEGSRFDSRNWEFFAQIYSGT